VETAAPDGVGCDTYRPCLGRKAMEGDTRVQRLERETGGRLAAIRLARRIRRPQSSLPARTRSSGGTGSCAGNFSNCLHAPA
jgi:hypothetical protein